MILRLLLILLLSASSASAWELTLEGGVGVTYFQPTVEDGIWFQQAFPHKFYTDAFAWKAGLGARINPHWSIHAAYVNLGTVKADTQFVWDQDYDPIQHQCVKNCTTPHTLSTTDFLRGPELLVGYHYPIGAFDPFVKAGMALMFHTVRATCTTSWGEGCSGVDTGLIPMVALGTGACYQYLCGEVTYYKGIAETGTPIAKDAIVPMLTLRIPLFP